jgi:hypothetical protein
MRDLHNQQVGGTFRSKACGKGGLDISLATSPPLISQNMAAENS